MGKIEGIERDAEKTDEGVVSSCEQEKGNLPTASISPASRKEPASQQDLTRKLTYHIDDGQIPCSIPKGPSRWRE
jgi:hypothetical protein